MRSSAWIWLVDREHDRVVGRIDVETDNVLEFLSKLRIVRQLECTHAMRGELMGLKDAVAVGYLTGDDFASRLDGAIERSERAKLIEVRRDAE